MHVCHVTLDHTPYDDRIYYKELWSLIGWADELSLVAKDDLEPERVYPEIHIYNFPTPKISKRLPFIREIVLDLQPDIIHLHEPELLALVPAFRRNTSAVLIYDMHEPLGEVIREFSGAQPWKRYLLSIGLSVAERAALPYVDGVIHTSLPLYNSFRKANVHSAILYNFPRQDLFPVEPHKDPERFTILYQGQIARSRGILELLQAFYHFYREVQYGELNIVGYIHPPEFEATLHQAIRYFSLSHAVTVEKNVPHTEMYPVLQQASVGVMALLSTPVFRKNVQIKTFEYMAAGLPVIAGDYNSARQFIARNNAGIIAENPDPLAIAQHLVNLAEHPEKRREMGTNGQKAVLEKYHWEKMGRRLKQFYTQVLAGRKDRLR